MEEEEKVMITAGVGTQKRTQQVIHMKVTCYILTLLVVLFLFFVFFFVFFFTV